MLREELPGEVVAGPLVRADRVQAAGTKERTTLYFPRYWPRLTFGPATEGR
jgi:hypothetical protein